MTVQDALQVPDAVSWVPASDAGEGDGIVAGQSDGQSVLVARCSSEEDAEVGTAAVVSGSGEATLGFFGHTVLRAEYDLLIASGSVRWVTCKDGEFPSGAIPVGRDALKRAIFVARVLIDGIGVPAKLIAQFRGAFAGWDGKEYIRRAYDVLCACEGEDEEQQAVDPAVPPEDTDLTDTHELDELDDPRREEADADLPEGLTWCYAVDGATFDNAVSAGEDHCGNAMHVARGSEERELACGVLRVGETYASIPYYKIGSKHDKYEILVNECDVPLKWVRASCGDVPPGAIRAGTDVTGEPIWVARCHIKGGNVAGKLVTWTKRAYGALDGVEYTRKKYEVLCVAEEGEEQQEEVQEEVQEEEQEEEDERKALVETVDGLEWLPARDGEVPDCAVVVDGGADERVFVARVSEEHELVPGGVAQQQAAVVPYYGIAEDSETYDVLINNGGVPLFWVPASCGEVPCGAVQAGIAGCGDEGKKIFVARASSCGERFVAGKITEGADSGYFVDMIEKKEIASGDYQVLCSGEDAEGADGAVQAMIGFDD